MRQELLLLDDGLLEQNQCLTQYFTHSRGSVSTGEWMPLSLCLSLSPRLMNLIFTNFFFFKKKYIFFDVDHFLSLYGICYNTISVFCFVFLGHRHVGS